jgi:integrase/recombinase XerC
MPAEPIERSTARIYDSLLDRYPARPTREAIEDDLADLGRFLGVDGPREAASAIIESGPRQADDRVRDYLRRSLEDGASRATVNRRLSTLRALVKVARRGGMIEWTLDVDGVKRPGPRWPRESPTPVPAGLRDTLIAHAESRAADGGAAELRDLAILRLLSDERFEARQVASLDARDVDLHGSRLAVSPRHHSFDPKHWREIGEAARRSLGGWIRARDAPSGPVFVGLDGGSRRFRSDPISTRSIFRIVANLCVGAGIEPAIRPRELRRPDPATPVTPYVPKDGAEHVDLLLVVSLGFEGEAATAK